MKRALDRRWWLVDEDERAGAVCAAADELRLQDSSRRADMRFWLDMYGCPELSGASVGVWVTSGVGVPPLSLNISRVIVDAARAEVTQTKPRPTFLTEDGDYRLRRKSKKLQQFCEGLFYDLEQYKLSPRIFDHAAVIGTGAEHVYEAFDKPCIERVPRWELGIPKADSYTGKPRQMFRSKPYDKYQLQELARDWSSSEEGNLSTQKFSAIRAAIQKAHPPTGEDLFGVDGRNSDLVMVHEAWRLADGPNAKRKGRHAIAIEGALLLDEEYEDDDFPFEFFRWEHDPQFFWGTGICELLQGIQYEINRLTMDIQEAHHLLGSPYWQLPRGANVVEGGLNNIPGHAIEFDGPAPPNLVAPIVVGQETFAYLWQLYAKAFEIARISPLSATGEKPAGLDSGEAQRVYEDIQNKRFSCVHDEWDDMHMGVAKKLLKVARRIADREGSFKARFVNEKFMRTVDLKEADIDDASMVMKVFPTSVLPSTPAGKTATVEQWIRMGWLTPAESKRLLGFPDLDSFMRADNANQEFLERQIDFILDKGEIERDPEPFMELSTLKLGMALAYIDAINNDVEEDKLDLFRQYVAKCVRLQQMAMQPPAPQEGTPEGAPPGLPMPPPGAGAPPGMAAGAPN